MKHTHLLCIALLFVSTFNLFAQEERPDKLKLEAGFDLTTTYLWRGFELGNGPAVQPWTRLCYKELEAGVWATTNLAGDSKEVDLYVNYSLGNFTLSFTDLFTLGLEGLDPNYFNFRNATTSHVSELGLSYGGSEKFPFTFFGGMMLYGLSLDPNVTDSYKMNHSTYFEAGYLGAFKDISYTLFAGFVPTESVYYETESFSFINVGFKVGKDIRINNELTVPTTVTLATSPERKTICVAAMCSF